jgi:hypothetical protein
MNLMIKKLFKLFDKFMIILGRKNLIYDRVDNELYLTRYYLFLKNRNKFLFNIFLHRFHKSDEETPHDHPWGYCTLILRGGYWEWIPFFNEMGEMTCEVQKWRGPGHFRICSPNSYHRIELKPGVTAWTLFMPFKKVRDWGFLVNNIWIQNEYYMKMRKSKNEQK